MPDTKSPFQWQNKQGITVTEHGRQYFIIGRNRILISEHFAEEGRPLERLLETAIQHAAKRSGD